MIQFDEEKQEKRISELRKDEEEEVAQLLSSKTGIPYINLFQQPVNTDALRLIAEKDARTAKVAAYDKINKLVKVGVLSPTHPHTEVALDVLKKQGFTPEISICSAGSLEHAWKLYADLSFASETKAGSIEISSTEIERMLKEFKTVEDVKRGMQVVLGQNKAYRVSRLFEIILAGALATKASDIHLETEENYVRLRYRLNGVLQNVLSLDRETYFLILSRLKLLSGLKLNIKEAAQDGRLSVDIEKDQIEIRVSILPGGYGESVVLRVLNPHSIETPLEELGLNPRILSILNKEMEKPNGMILTTGPTGSGKTTALYAVLKKIHTPDIKIITIEDPIEYHLPGIVQTQVEEEKGYTFLAGLRSALRQDPDVIMVGEIRDGDTASVAVNSALTGHLVFSTLHTNNAAGVFPRLIDLGINPKIISSALTLAMAQRLVRTLCPNCRKKVPLEGDDMRLVTSIFNSIPAVAKPSVDNNGNPIDLEVQYVPVGCDQCNQTGYKSRIGIHEAIHMDRAVEEVVINNPSEREIKAAALPQQIPDMRQDGILKMLQGITSLAELRRVIDLETDLQPEEEDGEKHHTENKAPQS